MFRQYADTCVAAHEAMTVEERENARPVVYTLQWDNVAAGSVRNRARFTVEGDRDFIWLGFRAYATFGTIFGNGSTLDIVINDRHLMDRETWGGLLMGDRGRMSSLIYPLRVPRGTTVDALFSNDHNAATAFYIFAHGIAVFR